MNFGTVPAAPSRRAFIVSTLLHCAAIGLLGLVWTSSPAVRELVQHATLLAPLPPPDRPVAPKLPRVTRRLTFVLPKNPLPVPVLVMPMAPIAAAPKIAAVPKLDPVAPPMPALPPLPVRASISPPAPAVRTDNFAGITVSPAVNSKPALPVETGAFQAPVSIRKTVAQTVGKTGEFDGRERQDSRTGAAIVKVAAAGFGDAQVNRAAPSPRGEVGSRGDAGFGSVAAAMLPVETKPAVRAGGFETSTAAPPALPQRQIEQVRPTEVEILWKPRPAYTEEARRLKIEGEVLVKVLFAASGEVKALSVEKGLGHGLDEAALQAAANIRFKPAKRGGVPVDSTAVARITFQLAY